MKKIATLLIIFLMTACHGFTADWVEVTPKAYLDMSSISIRTGYTYAWMKILNDGTMKPINGKKIHYYMSYDAYDCANKKKKGEETVFYGVDGSILGSLGEKYIWNNLIPETNGEYWHQNVCTFAN